MENQSNPFYFNLIMFKDPGPYRYLYFTLALVLYISTLLSNIGIMLVIGCKKSLHSSMYFLISCLSVNSLYGSSALLPRLLIDLLSESHLISRPACFTQIYVIYSYAANEFTLLGIMAYDRYIAICQPLHYHVKVTLNIHKFVATAWTYSLFAVGIFVYLSARLPLCDNSIPRVYCSNLAIVQLSCVDTGPHTIIGFILSITTACFPLAFVLYSYLKILLVCRKSTSEFRGKALQTCLPHIVTFVNYSVALLCDIALGRFQSNELNHVVIVIVSLEFVVIPPILNPLIYGLKLPEIRKHLFNLLSSQKTVS